MSDAQRSGFGSYMHANLAGSGRFSQFALIWASTRLFGTSAVNVLPLGLLALAVGLGAWALRMLARLLDSPVRTPEALLAASLTTVAVIATAPSLFDTVGWFAAVTAYLAGLVAAVGVATLALRAASTGPFAPQMAGTVVLLAALVGGFHEIVGAILTLAGCLAVFMMRDLSPGVSRRTQGLLGAAVLAAGLGTALNVLGPGAQNRARSQGAEVDLAAAAKTYAHNLSFVRGDAHGCVLLLAVAAGVVVWQMTGPVRDAGLRKWILVWSGFFVVVPGLITATLTAWAGSTESGDRSPFRAGFVTTSTVAVGLTLVVWWLLSKHPSLLKQAQASLFAMALVAAGTIGLADKGLPVITAELMRDRVLTQRAISVRHQLARHELVITLSPAPLLMVSTQALDLAFAPAATQPATWLPALRSFYGIPDRDSVRIITLQPRRYCQPGVTAPWVGVQSCEELRARRR